MFHYVITVSSFLVWSDSEQKLWVIMLFVLNVIFDSKRLMIVIN